MKNNNLCSIFHKRFIKLKQIIQCPRKAQLVDYILLGWQTSTYRLKNSNQKWFMKAYGDIVSETAIPLSTLQRYIKELDEAGFIVRRQALYSRTNEEGSFAIKKGNYLHPTEKLLALVKADEDTSYQAPINEQDKPSINAIDQNEAPAPCSNSDTNEGNEPLKSRGSNISDLYSSCNNTIDSNPFIQPVDKVKPTGDKARQQKQFDRIRRFLETEVKEEVSQEVKALIIATFCNLIFKSNKVFSNPRQLAAEYLWSLFNVDYCMPQITNLHFRNNALAKKIRDNAWRTPKGFFKHSWLGEQFKTAADKEKNWEQEKANEIADSGLAKALGQASLVSPSEPSEDALSDEEALRLSKKLRDIQYEIYQSGSELCELEASGKADASSLPALKQYLAHLYQQEKDIERQLGEKSRQTCAA